MAQNEPAEDGKPNNASASDKAMQMVRYIQFQFQLKP